MTSAVKRVFIAGHRGMVGAAIKRRLETSGDVELVVRGREQLDLTSQSRVAEFFAEQRIDQVYLAAAKVGGIHANDTLPAEFLYQNLMIEANIIDAAHRAGVERLLFLGSSCIYPRDAEQPMAESALLQGPLEPTNEPYAIAKIAGIKLCESYHRQYGSDFRSVMPTNLYGPHDNFHPRNSHVIPALLRKFHQAALDGDKTVTVWGSGRPRREFLHVNDMASACVYVMGLATDRYWGAVSERCSHLNVGTGEDISIADLAAKVAAVCGFQGEIRFDPSMPDGTPRKLLDVSRLADLGWRAEIDLDRGLRDAHDWMVSHWDALRGDDVRAS